ncbi:MAG: superoxide dismutase family protein [Deltaproteobacteria bacterium]|nr:superoxide dismutase family protein [Deltaproteobacteria bacterium]
MGSAVFTREGDDITLVLDLQNITPEGLHGTHIHEVGDCSAEDGTSAGGHWNPFGMQHGMLGMGESHLGDMGNAVVEANGDGLLTITTDQWTVGTGDDTDIIGRAIIVHEGEDDLSTMPSPGARIACGVIVAGG